ncbi:hypothetical protein NM208_g5290 [Fusarium decemcellulare]|uniref:Uncharacterized protein n=1 Tax=Fusarium decemcellulare TaxID=57161 RepID=A0ACC1SHN3_9HYPO|nr:hypothetical protein NM208_g5290 [Fusarium decemcellulare]
MVRIAVAGGFGDVGRTIVEVLGENSQNQVFTLSRKPVDKDFALCVDYDNVAGLHRVLEENSIEVAISCLSITDPTISKAEINLVRAAQLSSSTGRFIASQWAIAAPPGSSPLPDFSVATLAELETTNLEYTIVSNGHFSDYYGYPKVKTYLRHADFLIDLKNKTAAIPGSGDDKVVFTYSFDVARFVGALVSTSKSWPRRSTIIGDKITMNELLDIAQEARGAEFSVTYDGLEKLQALQVTELPSHIDAYQFFPKPILQTMFAVIGQWIMGGHFNLDYEGSLNEMFPHIKTKLTRDLIFEAWK